MPYIAGGNSYEASLFSFVRQAPDRAFGQTRDPAKARALYVQGDRDAGLGALDLMTDLQVTEPNRYMTRLMAKAGEPAYAYYFSYLPPSQRGVAPGASHGGELGYVFGVLAPNATPDAQALSNAMSAYWVAFAKTGSPDIPGKPAWPKVKSDGYAYMEFGAAGVQAKPDFLKDKLDFLSAR